ncbi:MAG: AAA family ATPase [Deltaproteobacteria bacterium]|nr:AAA family ATPase [Deltaproteobacteria bacterium]
MRQHTLSDYLNAGFPAIMLITPEYERAANLVGKSGSWKTFTWDCVSGIRRPGGQAVAEDLVHPAEALAWLKGMRDTVLLCGNLHFFLNDVELVQSILAAIPKLKSAGNCLMGVGPAVSLRPELEKYFIMYDLPLPDEGELEKLQADLAGSTARTDRQSAYSAKGLTEFEAEGAFALSLYQHRAFSAQTVAVVKEQLIRKSGVLECYAPVPAGRLGGLDPLKAYITSRARAFQAGSTLPRLKSLLLVGIPGCGKSLVCKTVSSQLNWPLIRLDIGVLKGSLVGESEKRIRTATNIIDAVGEAVVWLDEIEKQFAGVKSDGSLDAGVISGMFAHWLTWMQETTAPVLIMATANNISGLPPEFLRAGRFDKIWFVDLPSLPERREILRIMNERYGTDIPPTYAEKLEGYSGAEIESFVKNSCFVEAEVALEEIIPLSRLMRGEVEAIRNWAKSRAACANTPDHGPEWVRKIREIMEESDHEHENKN